MIKIVSPLRIVSIVMIVFSLCTLSTVSLLNASAQYPDEGGDRYEYLGIRHDKNPHVCLFEPNPTHIDWDYWLEVEKVSHQAILDWQTEMTEFLPEGDWSLYTHSTVPYIEHWNKIPDDYRHCNIFLTFEAWNDDEDKALGYTGIDFSKSSHKFTFIVVFLQVVNNTSLSLNFGDGYKDPETGVTKFEINLNRESLPIQTVKPFADDAFEIKITDKFMIGYLYGTDGYGKPQPIVIDNYCLFDHGIKVIGCY